MNLNIHGRILAVFFVAAAALGTVAASIGGISMFAPAFAQGNITDGGNTTEGSMPPPPPDSSGGMAAPPPPTMTP